MSTCSSIWKIFKGSKAWLIPQHHSKFGSSGGTYFLGNETFIKLIPRVGSGDLPRAYKVTLRALDIEIPLPAVLEQTGPHFFKNRNSTFNYLIYNVNHLLLDKFVKFYNLGEVCRVLHS